jgi:YfiH family protein
VTTSTLGHAADWPAPQRVRSWQTTRHGGVSQGAYSSLNLAAHVGDDPSAVATNRACLTEALDLPAEPVWLEQIHGSRVQNPDRGDAGPADAAVSFSAGTVLVVMTADCLPVLLTTTDGSRIGVAHAGWRGLAGGVLEASVRALDSNPAEIMAWLGPAISQPAFEVGDEVRAAFTALDPAAAAAFEPNARGRWQADLYALARAALARAGVGAIYGGGACTYGESERYFSHRREAPCGRMASLIWLEN